VELSDDQLSARFREQKAEIEKVIDVAVYAASDDQQPTCLYERGIVLARDDGAEETVRDLGVRRVGASNRTGYARFATDDQPWRVARRAGPGGGVTPNHVVSITRVNNCPADEPMPVPAGQDLLPGVGDIDAGRGVQIRVLDTGLIELAGSSPAAPSGLDDPDQDLGPYGRIGFYAGHGSFIRGILARVAPAASVRVTAELSLAGIVTEHDLGDALERVMDDPPDIISLSAGTASSLDGPLEGLKTFMARLRAQERTLLVAAAGNNGRPDAFYPAAEAGSYAGDTPPRVVAVGALRQDALAKACFTNYGDWVTVYAPGERFVNTFYREGYYHYRHTSTAECRYRNLYPGCSCVLPMRRFGDVVAFDGRAAWSGTSFSTPIVAGLIAEHMTRTSMSAPEAARDLLRTAPVIKDETDGEEIRVLLPLGYPPRAVD